MTGGCDIISTPGVLLLLQCATAMQKCLSVPVVSTIADIQRIYTHEHHARKPIRTIADNRGGLLDATRTALIFLVSCSEKLWLCHSL